MRSRTANWFETTVRYERQVCHYALRTLHLHQLYAIIATDNMASQQLFSETGFTGRNVLKEWLFDGMTYKDAIVMQKFF